MTSTVDPLECRIVAFFTADHAAVASGKLYVNGAFCQQLNIGDGYPTMLSPMSLVTVIEVPFGELDTQHTVEVGLEDPDGQPLTLKLRGGFQMGRGVAGGTGTPSTLEHDQSRFSPLVLPVVGLVLRRPGKYNFICSIDGIERGRGLSRAGEAN